MGDATIVDREFIKNNIRKGSKYFLLRQAN